MQARFLNANYPIVSSVKCRQNALEQQVINDSLYPVRHVNLAAQKSSRTIYTTNAIASLMLPYEKGNEVT
jgi:hypothetical protein